MLLLSKQFLWCSWESSGFQNIHIFHMGGKIKLAAFWSQLVSSPVSYLQLFTTITLQEVDLVLGYAFEIKNNVFDSVP